MVFYLSDKSKKIIVLIGKLTLIVLSLFFIIERLKSYPEPITLTIVELLKKISFHPELIGIILLLSLLNWFLEIKKWQLTIKALYKIDFKTALHQTLVAHAVSLITPFKLGEVVTKTYFFKNNKKNTLILTVYANIIQFSATVFFGYIATTYFFISENSFDLKYFTFLTLIFMTVVLLKYKVFDNRKIKKIKPHNPKIVAFSFTKYLVFSIQYFIIITFFSPELLETKTMMMIYLTYFLSSILPLISFLDVVIKGGVALFVFSFFGYNQDHSIITTSFLMWVLNYIFPCIIGLILLIKPKKQSK